MKLVVLSGATATGKSSLAYQLALDEKGVVYNFDSLLFYKELNIGTAKPSPEELEEVPHYMVNITSAKKPLNAADYVAKAAPEIHELLQKKEKVFLTGGSGFYLRALLKGMYPSQTTDKELLSKSDEIYEKQGIEPFIEELKQHDPKSLDRLHTNDHYRLRRAVEHFWSTGTPFSESSQELVKFPFQKDWQILHCYLDIPKNDHYEIIQKRTKIMLERGLIDEVQELLK